MMTLQERGRLGAKASYKTNQRLKQESIERYNLKPKKCSNCYKFIEYQKQQNKFCNSSCAAEFNNKKRETKKVNCNYCGASISSGKSY